jgi:hypothetical protein
MKNLWASDSDSASSENERTEHPPTPLELCEKAAKVFADIKNRTAVHIESLYQTWRDTQNCKHKSAWVDKDGVMCDAGKLITMSRKLADEILSVVNGDMNNEIQDMRIKTITEDLTSKSKKYVYEVRFVWSMLNDRKDERREPSDRMYRDLGMLMQLEDREAQEIYRRLRNMARKGELAAPKKTWDRFFKQELEEGWEYKLLYPAREDTNISAPPTSQHHQRKGHERARDRIAKRMTKFSLDETPAPGTKEPTGDEEQKRLGHEEAKTTETGFRPQDGDWQCRCEFWNRSWWGFCRNDRCVMRARMDSLLLPSRSRTHYTRDVFTIYITYLYVPVHAAR